MARFRNFIVNLVFDVTVAVLGPVYTSLSAVALTGVGMFRRYYRFRIDGSTHEQINVLSNRTEEPSESSAPAEEVASAPAEEVASAPAEEVASAPAEEVASAPAEEVASAPAEEVASAPAEEQHTMGDDYFASESSLLTDGSQSSIKVLSSCKPKETPFDCPLKHDFQQTEMSQEKLLSFTLFKDEMVSVSKSLDKRIWGKFSRQPTNAEKKLEQSCGVVSGHQHPVSQRSTVTDSRKFLPVEEPSTQILMWSKKDHNKETVCQKLHTSLDEFKKEMQSASIILDNKIRTKFPQKSCKPRRRSCSGRRSPKRSTTDSSTDERPTRLSEKRGKRLRRSKFLSKSAKNSPVKCGDYHQSTFHDKRSKSVKETSVTSIKDVASTSSKVMKPVRHVSFASTVTQPSADKVKVVSKESPFFSSKTVTDLESYNLKVHGYPKLDCPSMQLLTTLSSGIPENLEALEPEIEITSATKPEASVPNVLHQIPETAAIASAVKGQQSDCGLQADQSLLESYSETSFNSKKVQFNRMESIDSEQAHSSFPQQTSEIPDSRKFMEAMEHQPKSGTSSGSLTSDDPYLKRFTGADFLLTESDFQQLAELQRLSTSEQSEELN